MSQKKNEWIVLDYSKEPNEMVCEICNTRQKLPPSPMPMSIMLANLNAFERIHKRCPEAPPKHLNTK